MQNLTEDGTTYPTAVSVPQDAIDFRTAASVRTAFQALANRTRFIGLTLGADVDGTNGGVFGLTTLTGLICSTLVKADHFIGVTYIRSAGTLEVDGASALQGVACTTLTASGTCMMPSLTVSGTVSCVTLNVSGQIFANGGLTVPPGSFLAVQAASTLTAPFVPSGAGRVPMRRVRRTTNAAIGDIGPQLCDLAVINATGALTLTLTSTTQDGDWIRIKVESGTNTVTVNDPGVGTILSMKIASGFSRSALFVYDSSQGQYVVEQNDLVP